MVEVIVEVGSYARQTTGLRLKTNQTILNPWQFSAFYAGPVLSELAGGSSSL